MLERAGCGRPNAWFARRKRSCREPARYDRRSPNSGAGAVSVGTLASVPKHSCRAFADLGLTPDTGT